MPKQNNKQSKEEDRTGENQRGESKDVKSRGRTNKSRKANQKARKEQHRTQKGEETKIEIQNEIKKTWIAGLETAEKLEAWSKRGILTSSNRQNHQFDWNF